MAKNQHPLVTVGIPFYNSEKYLDDAIKSVLNQSYNNIELLLVDDGSSDQSIEIAKKNESNDSRVRLICDGKNLGLPSRLNQLSKLAKGKFYSRMDADDIMHPERLSIQIAYLQENTNVDLLGSGLIAIDNDNNITGLRKGSFMDNFNLTHVLKTTWAVHPTITGKTAWFCNNPYDANLKRAQDYDLWIRTVEKSNFVRLEQPLLFYREASTPSLSKYVKSTKYSINIFFKNSSRVGYVKVFTMTIVKLMKLFVYFLYSVFGATDSLIKRRSLEFEGEEKEKYNSILVNAIK